MASESRGGTIIRRPQYGKTYGYLHRFTPNIGQWIAGAINARDAFQIDGDSDFLITKQAVLGFDEVGQRLGDTVAFEATPASQGLNTREMFLSTLGSGFRPNQINPPIMLGRSAIFTAALSNRNAAGTLPTVIIAHHGVKLYRNPVVGQRLYRSRISGYRYPAIFADFAGGDGRPPLAAGASDQVTLRIDGDSDFDIRKLIVVSDAPVTVQVITMEDQWFKNPVRSELLGGSRIENAGAQGAVAGEYPWFMPADRLVEAASYISVLLTNTDVVNEVQAMVVFEGDKLYPAGGVR